MCGSEWWGASNTRITGPERVSASVSSQPWMCKTHHPSADWSSVINVPQEDFYHCCCFCRFGSQSLTLSKIVPHICHLLGDPTSQVRPAPAIGGFLPPGGQIPTSHLLSSFTPTCLLFFFTPTVNKLSAVVRITVSWPRSCRASSSSSSSVSAFVLSRWVCRSLSSPELGFLLRTGCPARQLPNPEPNVLRLQLFSIRSKTSVNNWREFSIWENILWYIWFSFQFDQICWNGKSWKN